MLFNSLQFAVFFPLVCALYFALPQRGRTLLLLVASCVFYMAFIPAYIAILAVTIAIDYLAGLGLERVQGRSRRLLLGASIAATCGVLFIFKYYNFFTSSVATIAALIGWNLPISTLAIILPIGLSFHTFQSLSYVIEVYRGRQLVEHNLLTYATYVMFFPQLVAGPIERPQNLLHQFRETHPFEYERITSGLKRMAWGFFKKLVIADRLALYVNDVYDNPRGYDGLHLTVATVFFAYQIYCDFSGYSDIAIGTARVLGFRLMENFDRPYHAASTGEFWRRWHISLSTWFRDYLYIPLGGNQATAGRQRLNLLLTFAVSGLWHGANWTYVIWGTLNGLYLVVGRVLAPWRDRGFAVLTPVASGAVRRTIRVATTFLLTCIAWTFFRATNLSDAGFILSHLSSGWFSTYLGTPHFLTRQFPVAVLGIAVLELVESGRGRQLLRSLPHAIPLAPRWAFYAASVTATVMLGVYGHGAFIYFQF